MDGTHTGSLGMAAVMTIVVWSGFLLLVVGCLGVGYAQKRLDQGPATVRGRPSSCCAGDWPRARSTTRSTYVVASSSESR